MRFLFFFFVGLAAPLVGCQGEERSRAPASEVTFGDSAVAPVDDTGATLGDAARIDSASDDTARVDATSPTDSATAPDLGPAPDVTIIDACKGPYAAFTTGGLVAGGLTPKAFATAYNTEVAALKKPGPMLLAFKGVDSADSSKWKLRVGGLDLLGGGPEVKFRGPSAEVDYLKSAGVSFQVKDQLASFKLAFDKGDLPVAAIRLSATAGDCTELSVDSLVILIPDSARDDAFGGSTVGALMGAPIASDAGPSVFVLELLGSDKKATIGGGVP